MRIPYRRWAEQAGERPSLSNDVNYHTAVADPSDRAHRFSQQVLHSLQALGLPPSPENYAAWYLYASGANRALCDEIDTHLATRHGISNEALRALHDRHLGSASEAEGLERVSGGIDSALKSLLIHIGHAGATAVQHGQTLGTLTSALRHADPADLTHLVHSLMGEAERMAKLNRQLEERLNQSAREIARLRSDLETVRLEANTDPLTGLSNRRAFERVVSDRLLSHDGQLLLLMLDLDHFHRFNEQYGHTVGDQVLRLVGRTIQTHVPAGALSCRYGGEEFCIALPDCTVDQGRSIAETLCTTLSTRVLRNRRTGDMLGNLTLSIGMAAHQSGESQHSLFERTEAALLSAKAQGRNRVCTAEDDLDELDMVD